jgi:hypothetical protein
MINDILSIALIGTSNSSTSDLASFPFSIAEGTSMEEKILLQAAWISLSQKAGFQPEIYDGDFPESCEKETLELMPSTHNELLNIILATENNQPLIVEWMEKMIAKQWIFPPNLLPNLLVYCKSRKELHPLFAQIIGKRGFWLAEWNPEWAYIRKQLVNLSEEDWETGNSAQRLGYLYTLRSKDAAAARKLIEEAWKTESLQQKMDLLDIFSQNLSAEDEVFLSSLLSEEKAKEIKRKVALLLGKIPHSSLQKRMENRVKQWISITKTALGITKIDILLPEMCTSEMELDGIDIKSKGFTSSRQGWVAQGISILSPNVLFEENENTLSDWIKIIDKSDWRELLLPALVNGAVLHHSENWIKAFLYFRLKGELSSILSREKIALLVNALSSESFGTFIQKVTPKFNGKHLQFLLSLRQGNWGQIETKTAFQEIQRDSLVYIQKSPWQAPAEFVTLIKQSVSSVPAEKMSEFITIYNGMCSLSAEWTKELHTPLRQMSIRERIAALFGGE